MHYSPVIAERDKKKLVACKEFGITLITVPFWWDGKFPSVAATVQSVRPDITIDGVSLSKPIPLDHPKKEKTLCTIIDCVC